jgi:hypothetical protein
MFMKRQTGRAERWLHQISSDIEQRSSLRADELRKSTRFFANKRLIEIIFNLLRLGHVRRNPPPTQFFVFQRTTMMFVHRTRGR